MMLLVTNSERAKTKRVGAGRRAPVSAKRSRKAGMIKMSRKLLTTAAMLTTHKG
jgi:hypothetical protein